jgi:serine protease
LLVPANYPTIQAGIDAAGSGDTVVVSPGTYYENLDFKGKAITVASAAGPETTIIDGGQAGAVVNFSNGEGPDSIIKGFTLQNGSATWGSGISVVFAAPTIISNIIQNNESPIGAWGAGVGGLFGSPTVEQNLFRNNSGDSQFLSGVISFVNDSSPLIADNLFVDNSCRAINLILPVDSAPVVINNTIVGNPVGIGASINGLGVFENNILFNNDVGVSVGGNFVWANNLVYGGSMLYDGQDLTGTNGNISADPLFVDPASADFHLQSGSPAVDAGDNAAPFLPAVDFDGNPRVVAGHTPGPAIVDIGAFEFRPTNSVVATPTITCPEPMTVECGLPVVPMTQVFSPAGNALAVVWSVNGVTVQTNLVPASNPPATAGVTAALGALPLGTNLVEVTVSDSSSNTASCSTTITVVDTMPPVMAGASASPNVLWPPSHQMVSVAIKATATDDCGAATWKIVGVDSNEAVNGHGDGNTARDWQILGDHTVLLRAERSGTGQGRIYWITLQGEDASGNLSTPVTVVVTVPKNQGK